MPNKIKDRLTGIIARRFAISLRNLFTGRFDKYTDLLPIITYFCGCKTADNFRARYALKLYKDLLAKYAEDGHFKFGSILLPKAENMGPRNLAGFMHEFLDIIYPTLSGHVNNDILAEGPYEYASVKIEKGDVIIDAGANIGMFSALAASKGATVYAFEPVEELRRQYLETTARLNGNIHIIPMALSDRDGFADIHVDSDNLGVNSIVFNRTDSLEQIQTITLDSFVRQNNIPKVDFIKADIEGAERLLLSGAQSVLRQYAPKLSICTYHLPDDKEVLSALIMKANPAYKIDHKWYKLYAAK